MYFCSSRAKDNAETQSPRRHAENWVLFRCYAVAYVLVLILGQHALADQVVFIAVGAVGNDFTRVAGRYSRKRRQIAFTGGIYVHSSVPSAIPAFLHTLGSGLSVVRSGLGHLAHFSASFFEHWLGILGGFGYFFA